jgi:hypothetical protein
MAFRTWLLNDAGEALLYFDHVRLRGPRRAHPEGAADLRPRGLRAADAVRRRMAQPRSARGGPGGARHAVLVFGCRKALGQLSLDKDKSCRCVADADLTDKAAVEKLLQKKAWIAVVLADGLVEESGDVAWRPAALSACCSEDGFKNEVIHNALGGGSCDSGL